MRQGSDSMSNYTIAVAGTGYVGLANAILLAQNNKVYAVDIVQEKVDLINSRKSPIIDKEIDVPDIPQEFSKDVFKAYSTMERKKFSCVEFSDVEFAYHESDESVLYKLNFDIRFGEITALVGQSGAGKTTIFDAISLLSCKLWCLILTIGVCRRYKIYRTLPRQHWYLFYRHCHIIQILKAFRLFLGKYNS